MSVIMCFENRARRLSDDADGVRGKRTIKDGS